MNTRQQNSTSVQRRATKKTVEQLSVTRRCCTSGPQWGQLSSDLGTTQLRMFYLQVYSQPLYAKHVVLHAPCLSLWHPPRYWQIDGFVWKHQKHSSTFQTDAKLKRKYKLWIIMVLRQGNNVHTLSINQSIYLSNKCKKLQFIQTLTATCSE